MENTNPKVSVCIPTYNHARFLGNAIESALAQTFADFELIIVDNCSLDNTRALVEEFRSRDRRIRYHRNERNIGAQNNFNRCIELASGEYIKILCSDDLLEPDCIQESVRALDEFPGASLVACARIMTDRDLRPLKILAYAGGFRHSTGSAAMKKCLMSGNLIGEPTAALFRKKDVAERGFNANYRQLIDLEMWFYLLQKGDFVYLPKPLCRFRRHGEQETGKNIRALNMTDDAKMILEEYAGGFFGHLWKIQAAFDIWAQQFSGVSISDAHRSIRKLTPLPLLYAFLPFKITAHIIRTIRGRLALLQL